MRVRPKKDKEEINKTKRSVSNRRPQRNSPKEHIQAIYDSLKVLKTLITTKIKAKRLTVTDTLTSKILTVTDTLKAKTGIFGTTEKMTLTDNEIDVSSGDLTLDVAGDIIADVAGGQFTIKDTTIGDPDLVIESNSNDALSGTLTFNKAGRTGAIDDYVGMVVFNGTDASDNLQNYAYIHGRIDVPTHGQEGGRLELGVASHDGGGEAGLTLTGGSVDTEVDVTIGKGTSSMTTIAGDTFITKKAVFADAGEYIVGTGTDLNIVSSGAIGLNSSVNLEVLVGRDVNLIVNRNVIANIAGNLYIDLDGGEARLTDDSETDNVFTPAHDADIATKKYVDDNAGGATKHWMDWYYYNANIATQNVFYSERWNDDFGVSSNINTDLLSSGYSTTTSNNAWRLIRSARPCPYAGTLTKLIVTCESTGADADSDIEVAVWKGTRLALDTAHTSGANHTIAHLGTLTFDFSASSRFMHKELTSFNATALAEADWIFITVRKTTSGTNGTYYNIHSTVLWDGA